MNQLQEELQSQIDFNLDDHGKENMTNWDLEIGVLISVSEAKYLLNLLKNIKSDSK